ncbi:Cytochrome P450 [Microlunatus soli]|uniref:Cytochrome P450 n=2 Tax=Microlunatus soli TaxID=630515 RepID=A0A1H1VXK4_9ACTN|nr:Cytochrome P450 [Microlunatus soli]
MSPSMTLTTDAKNEPMTTGQQPPESASLFSLDFIRDPYPTYAQLRANTPVTKVRSPHGFDMWLLVRFDDVSAALTDRRMSRDLRNAPDEVLAYTGSTDIATNQNLLTLDPPDHTRMRKLVQSAFTSRRVRDLEESVAELVQRLMDAMTGRPQVDLVPALGFALPLTVICRLLGIPNRERPEFRRWMDGLMMSGGGQAAADRLRESQHRLVEYFQGLVRRKRIDPGDDLLSAMIEATDNDQQLSADELVGLTFNLLVAGHETTVGLLSTSMMLMITHPEQLAAVQSEPERWGDAIDEVLRFEGPAGISLAITTEDVEYAGQLIPAQSVVAALLQSANRDPGRFDHPDRFDVAREGRSHLGFGAGLHRCIGAPLAKMEARIAVPMMFERFPDIALDTDQLQWMPTPFFRQLRTLPVRLAG